MPILPVMVLALCHASLPMFTFTVCLLEVLALVTHDHESQLHKMDCLFCHSGNVRLKLAFCMTCAIHILVLAQGPSF